MKREHLYFAAIAVVAVVLAGAVYQFYFQGLLQDYRDNVARRNLLRTRLAELHEEFQGVRPTVLVSHWRGNLQPWADTVENRLAFFRMDELPIDPIPDNTLPKFHYTQEFDKRVRDLQNYAFTRNPPCQLPQGLFNYFGTPTPDSVQALSVSAAEVTQWLRQFDRSARHLRIFIDAGAEHISQFEIWPPQREDGDLLVKHTVGATFGIRMERLLRFLDSVQRADRFMSVDSLRIETPNLIAWPEQPLIVSMVLTQARAPEAVVQEAAAAATTGAAAPVLDEGQRAMRERIDRMRREAMEAHMARQQARARTGWWWSFREWIGF